MDPFHPNPHIDPIVKGKGDAIWRLAQPSVEFFTVSAYDANTVNQRWTEMTWKCLQKSHDSSPNFLLFFLSLNNLNENGMDPSLPKNILKLTFVPMLSGSQ
ncbi:MAG: hypothetical protein VB013_15055 [Anaerolineaceae bacterium]|nr:hypothetical protein [Anaerolineaceae bacterium]